jgi:hypothetical protein
VNFAHLQVGAGGDVTERSAQALGKIGHAGKPPVFMIPLECASGTCDLAPARLNRP